VADLVCVVLPATDASFDVFADPTERASPCEAEAFREFNEAEVFANPSVAVPVPVLPAAEVEVEVAVIVSDKAGSVRRAK
jgi:hypothetical protein